MLYVPDCVLLMHSWMQVRTGGLGVLQLRLFLKIKYRNMRWASPSRGLCSTAHLSEVDSARASQGLRTRGDERDAQQRKQRAEGTRRAGAEAEAGGRKADGHYHDRRSALSPPSVCDWSDSRSEWRTCTDSLHRPLWAVSCSSFAAMSTGIAPSLRHSARSVKSSSSSLGDKPPTKPTPKPVSLPRRLLFPTLPADADLPPLLASPAAAPVLNAELYEFIALALRAYINPWWTKLTRYDKEFLPDITRILTCVLRTLETRLLATDLSPLIFRDLPTLLVQHCSDFRNAKAKLHTSYAAGGAATLPQLFHHLQPHMAIGSDGRIDDVYVRQAVDHILKACLPPEDYDSEAERYIVREIILSVLLKSVIPRVTQPWFIHKIILDQMGPEVVGDMSVEVCARISLIRPYSGDCGGATRYRPMYIKRYLNESIYVLHNSGESASCG